MSSKETAGIRPGTRGTPGLGMGSDIEEIGGVSREGIQLLVSEARHDLKNTLDTALNIQELKIEAIKTDVDILVGSSKLEGLVSSTKKTIETLAAKHEIWHGEDIDFRSSITDRVTKIETDSGTIAEQVASMKWLVMMNHYLIMTVVKGFNLIKEAGFLKLILSIGFVWGVAHYAPNLWKAIEPYLHYASSEPD